MDERGGGSPPILASVGRGLGFCVLASAGLMVFAAVILLPEYARLLWDRYETALAKAINDDLKSLIQANQRLIADLPDDPVLTKRLAMRQWGLVPENEVVLADLGRAQPAVQDLIVPVRHPRPAPPDGWVLRAAQRISEPSTRRGLLLLAAAAILGALFLFAPRESPSDGGSD